MCVVSCAVACNDVAAVRDVSRAAVARLIADGSRQNVGRALTLQLPLALAQVGAYSGYQQNSNNHHNHNSKNRRISNEAALIEHAALDAVERGLPRANLAESWYVLLFWRHAVSPLLRPDVAEIGQRLSSVDGVLVEQQDETGEDKADAAPTALGDDAERQGEIDQQRR